MFTTIGMPQILADAYRAGQHDAYDLPPERQIAEGAGNPCRCCLNFIPKGKEMLVLAHRPFQALHPYAETGPVFLCAAPCQAHLSGRPDVLQGSPDYLLKGYDQDERIIYGTGQITAQHEIDSYVEQLLARPEVAFVDMRSSRNNCWLARFQRSV
jgi:hypothetical protein